MQCRLHYTPDQRSLQTNSKIIAKKKTSSWCSHNNRNPSCNGQIEIMLETVVLVLAKLSIDDPQQVVSPCSCCTENPQQYNKQSNLENSL
ncbi:hypothetical protein AVEN_219522-1 [Araneus ventricosus]|uniref:Uncharacterized protein n=1 Tax=Araneus ventricosus TaxID=182803 RepID=A0A4Y2BN86_ARAVE|nr:hypothetical protein AVEN_219522-1 [Araneus ventricosus]